MLRLLLHFFSALCTVALRRSRTGPACPGWSFGFEVLVQTLRLHSHWMATLPVPALRRAADQLKSRIEGGVSMSKDRIGDVPVTSFLAPEVVSGRVILYLHGGGYVFGSAAQDAGIASQLAKRGHARVVAPDFRLAPEATYPAAVEDVVRVYRRLREQGEREVVIAGLSSGAGLALSVLMTLRDAHEPLASRAILLSPMVDATGTSVSWSANAALDWGQPDALLRWARFYAGSRSPADPGISPVNGNLGGLPPILVVVGELELGHDDAATLVRRAQKAGVEAVLHVEPDMVHAFMTFGRSDAPTRHALDLIEQFLNLPKSWPASGQ